MLNLTAATRILVALEPVDMRQGFNGLYTRVQSVLQEEPTTGHLFVFTNKLRNRLKILFFDGSGLWIVSVKRSASLRSPEVEADWRVLEGSPGR
jgi:transposase